MVNGDPPPFLQVTCVGQVICAVAADTKQNAKRGAAALKITYEDLPDPVFTVEVSGSGGGPFFLSRPTAK